MCAVIASPLLSCAQHASDSEVSIAESVVCVPIPQVRVPISRGMRATSGGACAPLGFGRENERVSETRPSEKPDPQRSQAGAHHLDQFFIPSSQFSDTSNETLVPNARIADFSKKNANFQMSSTEKSVSFSN